MVDDFADITEPMLAAWRARFFPVLANRTRMDFLLSPCLWHERVLARAYDGTNFLFITQNDELINFLMNVSTIFLKF